MPRKKQDILNDLTLADLKSLIAAKEKIVELEVRRDKLSFALSKVEAELKRVLDGAGRKARKTTGKKKKAKRVIRRKPIIKKATGKKKARKKAVRKKAIRKKVARTAQRAGARRVTLEDVVVTLISGKGKGASLSFQDLLATIQKKKLYKTKSSNFANVLRRTLSTSKRVKRVARGIYAVA